MTSEKRPQPPEEPEKKYFWELEKLYDAGQAFSRVDREVDTYLGEKDLAIDNLDDLNNLSGGDVISIFTAYTERIPNFLAGSFHTYPYDDLLTEIGCSAFVEKPKGIYRGDVAEEAARLGASQEEIQDMDEHHPAFVGTTLAEGGAAYLLIPSQFIISARQNPIDALAGGTYAMSQLRDFTNGLSFLETDNYARTKSRARATVAQFLNFIPEEDRLFVSQRHKDMLSEYPNGTYSLPDDYRYKGLYRTGRDLPQDGS